jgi:hypothetical protein
VPLSCCRSLECLVSRLVSNVPVLGSINLNKDITLLKSTDSVMHQQDKIQEFYILPHCTYVFCIYLRTSSDVCAIQHELIGFYNQEEKCLQSGTNWAFK